jgi:phytanoyl-CoA hydroxylase
LTYVACDREESQYSAFFRSLSRVGRFRVNTSNDHNDADMNAEPTLNRQLVKFDVDDIAGMREYYEKNGYVVLRSLIERSLIDRFLIEYERIKRSHTFIYFSQSIHRAIRPEVNEFGFIRESMQDATRLGLFPLFSDAIKQCIYHGAVSSALTALDGHERHVSWQDMFFDLSTGTIEHADTWYLDTDPPGSLVGVWLALEDIEERAGTFFVMPASHRVPPLNRARYTTHEEFRKAMLKFVVEHGFEPKGMPIDKGDVILWHPFLVHGAFSNRDPRFSRKSLTSHFLPYGAARQDKAATPLEPTFNPLIFRVKRANDVLSNLALYARFWIDAVRGRSARMDMRRKSYSN